MSKDLAQAFTLIQAQSEQITRLAKLHEMQFATAESISTLVQAMLPFMLDKPEFIQQLKRVHEARLGQHLQQDVSNAFIGKYMDIVNAFLPPELKFPLPTLSLGGDR